MTVQNDVGTTRQSHVAQRETDAKLKNLRNRLSASELLSGEAGIGDPFAEIFAQIASATAPPPPTEISTGESEVDHDAQSGVSSDQPSSGNDENDQEAEQVVTVALAADSLVDDIEQERTVSLHDESETETLRLAETPTESDETLQQEPIPVQGDTDGQRVEADESAPGVEIKREGEQPLEATIAPTETVQSSNRVRRDASLDEQKQISQPTGNGIEESSSEVNEARPQTLSDSSEEQGDQQDTRQQQVVDPDARSKVNRRRYGANQPIASDQPSESSEGQPAVSLARQGSQQPSAVATAPPIDAVGQTTSMGTNASAQVAVVQSTTSNAANTSAAASGSKSVRAATSRAAEPIQTGATTTAKSESATSQSSQTAKPDQNSQLSAVQRARLVKRVSRGFQQLGPEGGRIRLRLSPSELGSVKLELQIKNHEMSGQIVAQNEAATQALREQLPSLRASLEAQGIRLERLEIQTESSAQDGALGRENDSPGFKYGDSDDHHRSPRQRTDESEVRTLRNARDGEVKQSPVLHYQPSLITSGVDLQA